MKKIIIFIFSISFSVITLAQNDTGSTQKYILRSPRIILDVNGNAYYSEKVYDHIPTHEDSVSFVNEDTISTNEKIDSVERENARYSRYIDSVNKIYNSGLKNYAPLNLREGKHLFSLHWISWQKFGSVTIKKVSNKKYSIKGAQKDDKGNYVTINGFIQPIKRGELKFNGEIVTKVSGNNKGEPCVKKGEFTFLCSLGRKFWRLQERYNCEESGLVDYVDIFF